MDLKRRLQRSFKPRFAVIYPFALFVVFCGRMDDQSLRAGIGLVIAGLLLRLWSNGYAIKNDKLTTSGPYALVRNPLYLGTFLIAAGFVIVLNMGWVGVLFLSMLIVTYAQTIRDEQHMLAAKFGDAFRRYKAKVPAMIPALIPYAGGDKWPFSLHRLLLSKEHKLVCWLSVLLILFHLKSRLLLQHKPLTVKTWILVGIGTVLILLDILYEFNKKKFPLK